MEREIGKRFYIDDKQYEIVEQEDDSCEKCCFNNVICDTLIKEHIGFCSSIFREDKKNIIVKLIM